MSDKPLSRDEMEQLIVLLRRLNNHHVAPDMGRAVVMDAELMVRNIVCDTYPVRDPLLDLLNRTSVEDAAGLKPWKNN